MAGDEKVEHLDVLIVGAGLSGIGAAAHLQARCANKRFAILEARDDLGGTWVLVRYPGVRSDSDMYTLGYGFKPWTQAKAIADGAAIKQYIADSAAERGLDRLIRYGHRVIAASWSSQTARWSLSVRRSDGLTVLLSCNFLWMCAGYYAYDEGHRPRWPGEEEFTGAIVHPQFWPDLLDYAGKRVVVIGSGATAVTVAPELAKTAAKVTILQRSATYVVTRPSIDPIAEKLKRLLPPKAAYLLTRWRNIVLGQIFYDLARKRPEKVKKAIIDGVRAQVGADCDVERHFTPTYNPWDQRLCAVPDGDLFKAIRRGRVAVVTGVIEAFTTNGVRLASGDTLAADVVVTATGLKLNLLGDVAISVDGRVANLSKAINYKGCMFSGVPNLASVFGYTNASWTLKSDLVDDYVCRLLRRMDRRRTPIVTPRPDPSVTEEPFLDFTSGYVQRALDRLPKQGSRRPWKLHQNYLLDFLALRLGALDDGQLIFSGPVPEGAHPDQTVDVRRNTA